MQSVTNPTILRVDAPTKDVEIKVTLPPYTRRFRVGSRTDHDVKLAYREGDIAAGIYFTIKHELPNYIEENISSLRELYVEATNNNSTIEIVCWN